MITLGLVLALLVGGLITDVVVENGQHTDVTVLHQQLTVDSWGFFLAGVATGLVAVIALWLFAKGAARDSRRRREHRQLVREARANEAARVRNDRERATTARDSSAAGVKTGAGHVAPVAPADAPAGRGSGAAASADGAFATRVLPADGVPSTVDMDKPVTRAPRSTTKADAAPAGSVEKKAGDASATDGGSSGSRGTTLIDGAEASPKGSSGRTGVFARLRR
jgi:hypothetical protein